ncbi:iron-containing alcohol dehydrogenase [Lysobacter sp. N42]|nr:iron-containing alcohol dehydrogenase [Aliidiomarina sp. B3213]TCZ91759.1 iron-containing alcohol dehydrogenase [Lysobacter sp. N42]
MQIFKAVTAALPINWPKEFRGTGSTEQLLQHIVSSGNPKVLLVSDQNLLDVGVVQPIQTKLQELGCETKLFSEITPDPPMQQIEHGVNTLHEFGAVAVLAVGGGSVIDAAKLIAARALNTKPVQKMTGLFKVTKGTLPLYVIPTTAGTGSEVTIAAVVSDTQAQRKLAVIDHRLMPSAMALDANIMLGLPPAITAATGMDALTHAVEAYISRNATSTTSEQSLTAAQAILSNLPAAFENGKDTEARQAMAEASMFAGKAFTIAGVGYVHAIAHNLGARYHIPHGLANAMVMPYVLSASISHCSKRLAELARTCGVSDDKDDMKAGLAFIDHISELNHTFNIPLKIEQLKREDIPAIAKAARQEARFTYAVPRYFSQQEMCSLLELMLP